MALGPLPIDSGSAEMFYCCHVIEHISDQAVGNLCREAFRCLKPGGVIRFLTPDAELEFKAFRRGDRDFFPWVYQWPQAANASLERVFLNHFASQVSEYGERRLEARPPVPESEIARIFATLPMEEAFEYFTRQCSFDPENVGSHINWWTEKKLGRILRDAGFSSAYRSGHGQSLSRPMRDLRFFDAQHYIRFSLYMEAVK
jgi:predicted SAM-dependent methyltransferase